MEIQQICPGREGLKTANLRIRLLGGLQLSRADGEVIPLPGSKKTRALMGYLIATGQAHRRERLCDLFWQGPSDPRAELRWSLSKIRPLLNDGEAVRLSADREQVAFETMDAEIDLATIRRLLAARAPQAPVEALKRAVGLFRGEFLDGLDLPACYRYQEWCLAERDVVSRLHLAALAALVEALTPSPEDGLAYARALAAADPLSEVGHAAVVRFLGLLGRKKEALGHYEHARTVLEGELGAPVCGELEQARRALNAAPFPAPRLPASIPADASAREAPPSPRAGGPPVHFVGRQAERRLLDRLTLAAANRQASPVLFVTGEPGIGKSHFLARLVEGMIAIKGQAYAARAYEAEAARPYGIWIDLLRGIERERGCEGPWQPLSPLLPECGGAASQPPDRSRLFDGIAALLGHLAAAQPLALALDDIQWLDEASSSLLHYIARTAGPDSGLLLACAARSGELDDNAPAAGILRSLRREGCVHDVHLRPLSRDETAELVRAIDPRLDAARVFAESEGNPLFALTLSRDPARLDAPLHRTTLELVIRGQLARLKHGSRELLPWAAALGRRFTLDALAGVAGLATAELLAALEELERREIVQPVGGDAYDFVHDLLRETAYRSLSQPRRKLLHRQIARFLVPAAEADDGLTGELARHAGLGDDHQVAARACLVAGERCLRLFANTEADGFAERGLRHAGRMPEEPPRVEASIGLLKIRILAAAGPGMRPLPPVREDLAHAVARAEALGLHAASATGHYLLSVLSQEAGDTRGARESTLRAASAGRAAGPLVRARQLANTARCLTELETDIGRARLLVREAEALAGPLGVEICELHWGRGLLHRWDGEAELSAASLAHGLALARRAEDRWREYKCLTWMAMLELERGLSAETAARCAELMQVAEKLGEGEVPFAMALAALAEAMSGASVSPGLAGALERLRAVDDKSYLAYALNLGATVYLTRGELDASRARATEALVSAQAMHRRSEAVIARATLARLTGAGRAAGREVAALLKTFHNRDSVSARARSALLGAAAALGASVPAAPSPSQRRPSRLVGR